MNYLTILIPAITAVLGFLLGSFKPMIDWEIEKKRLKRKDRKAFIKEVRDYFEKAESFDRIAFSESMLYSRLKPYLSGKLIKDIEDPNVHTIHIVQTGDLTRISTPLPCIIKELRDLEEKWELI